MENARRTIRRIIFALTGLLVVSIVLRFFLVLFQASQEHFVSQIIFGISDPLLIPFNEMFARTGFGELQVHFEMLVAAVFYIFAGVLLASFITAFLHEKPGKILAEFLDVIFKALEFILFSRLILMMFGIQPGSAFVDTIYNNTEWVAGLLPTVDILGGMLEFSTLFILVGVVILDLVTEGAFEVTEKKQNSSDLMTTPQTTVIAPPPPPPNRQQGNPQNITINIPTQNPNPMMPPRQANPQVININKPENRSGIPYNNQSK